MVQPDACARHFRPAVGQQLLPEATELDALARMALIDSRVNATSHDIVLLLVPGSSQSAEMPAVVPRRAGQRSLIGAVPL